MVEDNIIISRIDFKKFKSDFEQKIVPGINEKLIEGETFTIEESEIKKLLCVNFCSTDNLYIKLRNVVSEKEFGVSIDKIDNNFVFFSKSGGMKRQSDILKVNFEEKLKPIIEKYLALNPELGIEEDTLKMRLGVPDYTTENIYQRLRNLLSNSDIKVSISKEENEKGFFFYRNKSEEEVKKAEEEVKKEDEKRRKEEELEQERIDAKVEDARRKDIERSMQFDEELLKLVPPPNFSDNFDPKIYNKEEYNEDIKEGLNEKFEEKLNFYTAESEERLENKFGSEKRLENKVENEVEYICLNCSSVIAFNSHVCPNCGIELNWKSPIELTK